MADLALSTSKCRYVLAPWSAAVRLFASRSYEREEDFDFVPIVHVLTNAEVPDRDRRQSLFSGDLFVYSPRPSSLLFAAASRDILEQAFGIEPLWAQQRMSESAFAVLFTAAACRSRQMVTELASAIVTDLGCDPSTTFIKRPSLAVATGRGFIAHGLGVPQHPHRDTWYAAPLCQVNWWIPLYALDASSSFAFHPPYWDLPIHNSSGDFDYEGWHDDDRTGWTVVTAEPFAQPRALDPIDLMPEIRISCPAGGVILSSVAQLYSTVPNEALKTHFSMHFQTVSEEDLEDGVGAPNLDAEPQGSSLSSFARCSDMSPVPVQLIRRELDRRRTGRLAGRSS